jgi:hypothetical protein
MVNTDAIALRPFPNMGAPDNQSGFVYSSEISGGFPRIRAVKEAHGLSDAMISIGNGFILDANL